MTNPTLTDATLSRMLAQHVTANALAASLNDEDGYDGMVYETYQHGLLRYVRGRLNGAVIYDQRVEG